MYLTVVAFAALFMTAFGVNANMNSNMNAYASIFSDIQNVDDVGQSLECVIVVVGCDAQGSVGSSGDVNIGVGDNDTTTDGETPIDPDTPLPPNPTGCEECIAALPADVLVDLRLALGDADATFAEICLALDALGTIGAVVSLLSGAGISAEVIVDILACLGVELTLAQVLAIIADIGIDL